MCDDACNNADCEKPTVGMRVRALEASDLKEKKRLRLQEEDPESYNWMEEMNGLGGVIAKLTNAKNNALVLFDSPEEANSGDENREKEMKLPLRAKLKYCTVFFVL